jgi:hypothetical protein
MLVAMQDLEYWDLDEDDTPPDYYYVLSTKKLATLHEWPDATHIPLTEPPVSPFEGMDLEEIEGFMVGAQEELVRLEQCFGKFCHYGVIDARGASEGSCVIVERTEVEERTEDEPPTRLVRMRVPWARAGRVFVNLEIANMSLEEYAGEEGADGVCAMAEWFREDAESETGVKVKRRILDSMRAAGHVD